MTASVSATSTAAALSAISAAGQRTSSKPSLSRAVMNQQNTRLPHLAPEAREGFDRRGYKFVPPYSVQRISAFSCGGLWTRLDFSGIIIVDESGFTEETN